MENLAPPKPPPERPLPPTPKKPAKYTLGGTSDWQTMQRSKPITTFSLREREFIKEALTAEFDPNLTGTRVIYVEPEGSDHMSLMSDDEESSAGGGPQGGKFKKIAKRLYPAKMVGGAKVVGVAIRHPMVTGRKVNLFQRKKNGGNGGGKGGKPFVSKRASASATDLRGDTFPALKRSVTVSEESPEKANGSLRKGILRRRRNSAPFLHTGVEVEIDRDIDDLVPDAIKADSEPGTHKYAASVNSRRASVNLGSPARDRPSPILLTPRSLSFLPPPSPGKVESDRDAETQVDELTEQADIRLTELEDELRSWTIESGSTVSEGSQSAPARPRVSIHRFAKIPQNVPVEDVQGREFTEAEYAYIEFVLDNLYDLIIASALDRSGVQYRNTFAWRYLTETRSEFDKTIGYRFSVGGKRFKIRNYVGRFDFRGALMERLKREELHQELGLRWSEISFVDRRIKIELSYCLSDDESENGE